MKALRLLLSHPEINMDEPIARGNELENVLWIARNNREMLECLLDPKGCNISIDYSLINMDEKNTTASNQLQYHKGANIKLCDAAGNNFIHKITGCHTDVPILFDLAIKHGVNINHTNKDGYTPLLNAIFRRIDNNCVEALLRNGANMNQRYKDGRTPIAVAFENNHVSTNAMKALLKYNCDLSTIGETTNETPFQLAFKNGNQGIFGDIFFRQFLKMYHNQPERIGGILDEPVFENGGTALHVAIQRSNLDGV